MDNHKLSPIAWAMMREAILSNLDKRINDTAQELKALKAHRSQLLAEGDNVGVGKRSKLNQQSRAFHVQNLHMLCTDLLGVIENGKPLTQRDIIIIYLTEMYLSGGKHPPDRAGEFTKEGARNTAEGEHEKYRKALNRFRSRLKLGT